MAKLRTLALALGLNAAGLGAMVAVAAPTVAHAQGADAKAAAEALFSQGKKQLEANQYAEACKSFEKSQSLDPSVGTLLNLGLCNDKQGKIASAWFAYKEAAQLARQRNDTERAKAAEDLAAPLEPKLSSLTVTSKGNEPGLEVKRDGERLSALDAPVPTDPGEHKIEASAPGFKPFTATIKIGAEADKQSLEIPALEALPPGEKLPDTSASTEGAGNGMPLKIAGFVVGGVGVIGLGLGIGMGVVASGTASSAEEDAALCPNKVCTPAGREEIDSAETQATISTVGFVVGGVALAAGVTLVVVGFMQDGDAPAKSDAAIRPTVFSVGGGPYDAPAALFGVEGAF